MDLHAHNDVLKLDVPAPRRPSECPVEDWLGFLGHRWNALILWHLKSGPRRHAELLDLLKEVTPKVLAERLHALEHRGLVERRPQSTFPRSVQYALSDRARSLLDVLDQLELWSKQDPRATVKHDIFRM